MADSNNSRVLLALRALDKNAERWLLLVFYTLVVVTITVEVVRRFVFSYSSIWGEELARYAFIYLAWVGASLAVRDRAHIRIDFLLARLSPRGQGVLCILSDLATLALAGVALFWSIHPIAVSLEYGSVTHGLRVSLAWFLAAVPLAFLLIVYRLLQSIRRDVGRMRRGEPVYASARLFD